MMATRIESHQHTLRRSVSCCGVGLHTGRTVNLTIKPAPVNSGIRFFRADLTARPMVRARMDKVVDTNLATTIGQGDTTVSTTEHLMAALHAGGIDNAEVELDSHEVPIMDGSAAPFLHLLRKGGRKRQGSLRKVLRVTKPVTYTEGNRSIRIEPYDGFKVTGSIHFDDELISSQSYSVEVTPERFAREIARARTFGYVEQVEHLWTNGLALGGTLDNVIAIHWDRRSVLNEEGLRYNDEFIRHKVLDLIGDLALLGSPILGHVIAERSGHGLHLGLMQKIADSPDCVEYISYRKKGDDILRQVVASTKSASGRICPLVMPTDQTSSMQQGCVA
jgi:UDP-3-O-[3-hydroxymyristoyl] N-acetylglucosamine deacetylase